MAKAPFYEHFEHQADMGVRGYGRTRDEAFEQAAVALTAVVVPILTIEMRERVRVVCSSSDEELLLLDWLSAVVYEMASRKMIFGQFKVKIVGMQLEGELVGEALDIARHQPGVEVKAATATALRVAKFGDGSWLAQCVVDV